MSLVVKKDEPFDPMNIAVLGLWTVMPRADRLPDMVEQSRFLSRRHRLSAVFGIQPAANHGNREVSGAVRVDVIYHNDSPCHSAYRSTAVLLDDFVERSWR
jgi:hypothetical protein